MPQKQYTSEDGKYQYTLGHDGKLRCNARMCFTDERFLLALRRLRKYVEKTALVLDDSDVTGEKHTHCSWGMCCDELEVYPDKQDWIWPERELILDKVSTLHFDKGQICPFDQREDQGGLCSNGCFYTCMFRGAFKGKKNTISRKQALQLIDRRIKEFESKSKKQEEA